MTFPVIEGKVDTLITCSPKGVLGCFIIHLIWVVRIWGSEAFSSWEVPLLSAFPMH